jgi:hypothetical protein
VRSSTVAEHTSLVDDEHVFANAPGRIAGSREHTGLAITRRRDAGRGA